MRIIINRKLLKGKKSETYFGKMERGGFLFHMTLVSAILKWQYQMAVKVFSVDLVILKNKIVYFWLDIE